jgi:polyisoprenoid-binding protein YceI
MLIAGLGVSACESQHDGKPSATLGELAEKDGNARPGGSTEAARGAEDDEEPSTLELAIDTNKTTVGFVGRKVTMDHPGKFSGFTGAVTFEDGQPTSVKFTVQMASLDIEPAKLEGHLKSPDFFMVDEHPTSTFDSTKIVKADQGGTHTLTGNLTLRGVTKQISFPATIEREGSTAHGSSEFKINRQDFGIAYPGMPDDLIADDVLIKLDLHFAAPSV